MSVRDQPGFIAWPPLGTPMSPECIAQTRAALNIPAFIQGLRAAVPSIDVPPSDEDKHHDGIQHQGSARPTGAGARPDRNAGGRRRRGARDTSRSTAAKVASGT